MKGLMEMSKEELWQLFPIFLTAHRAEWAEWFAQEAALLHKILPAGQVKRISHIGSTAIPTIWAKPIVDILVEPTNGDAMEGMGQVLAGHGYLCMSKGEGRLSFNKGYTPSGFAPRVYHLHLCRANGELYFRDYLLAHPAVAKEYQALKLGLWKRFAHDRDGYTRGKAEFVGKYTARARVEFGDRYSL